MSRSIYRWVIVGAGGVLGCIAIGSMFSLPVLLLPISKDTGWSVTGVSGAMTIGFLAMALASMVWGPLSDRWGPRVVVLIGLRSRRWWGGRRYLCADDGLRDRLVRNASQPRGVVSVGRHGNGADDHVASGSLAGLHLQLANLPADHRGNCSSGDGSRRLFGPSAARFEPGEPRSLRA
jgi:hypothetical protein